MDSGQEKDGFIFLLQCAPGSLQHRLSLQCEQRLHLGLKGPRVAGQSLAKLVVIFYSYFQKVSVT